MTAHGLDCPGESIFPLPIVLCIMLNPPLCTMKKAILSFEILCQSSSGYRFSYLMVSDKGIKTFSQCKHVYLVNKKF